MHDLQDVQVTIFGGTGFLGRYVTHALAEAGATIRIVTRYPEDVLPYKVAGHVGQVVAMRGNIRSSEDIDRAIEGADVVINLVGIAYERGKQRFAAIQAQGAERIARAAAEVGVSRLIHVSAMGVERAGNSLYARTKLTGEKAVLSAFENATILRPSVMFGAEDQFYNKFAAMAALSPLMPLIGGGKTRFQPVYVADVADAISAMLSFGLGEGKTIQCAGPRSYSFKEILDYIMVETGHVRSYVPLPFGLAGAMGHAMSFLPVPPLTADQVKLLKHDNVPSEKHMMLEDIGIAPTPVEAVVPHYLLRYRNAGQYARWQHEVGHERA